MFFMKRCIAGLFAIGLMIGGASVIAKEALPMAEDPELERKVN